MPREVVVVRCPECGSTDAGEAQGAYELALMRCGACGHSRWCDDYQIKFDWNVSLTLPDDATALPPFIPVEPHQ